MLTMYERIFQYLFHIMLTREKEEAVNSIFKNLKSSHNYGICVYSSHITRFKKTNMHIC
jgi:hypothetical protein